jgi:hypothetical protein
MEDAMQEVVEEGRQRAVDVRVLPAFVTKGAGKLGAAIQAFRVVSSTARLTMPPATASPRLSRFPTITGTLCGLRCSC